uniref:Uncharacterized protein n=1 Tax=Escherichia coli TaxID=562 RepID=A0A2S1JE00_ECOLX|nr:hypothetical protein [Escherichia coli]QIQ17347.1 hypothetical protein [Escherichia coli]QIQ18008.1 hypothetical protein [Escherichia coli]QIQ18208.1 hypothetical protein [Escherichia coli]
MFPGRCAPAGLNQIRNLGFSDLRAEDEEFSSRLVKLYLA